MTNPRLPGGKRTVLIGAVVIAALAVVFLLFKSILGSFSVPAVDQYQVPNVLGMTIEEAENDPRVKGIFEIEKAGSGSSEEYAEGQIMKQSPDSDETRKGSQLVIQVWVSVGEETGEMPKLENNPSRTPAFCWKS